MWELGGSPTITPTITMGLFLRESGVGAPASETGFWRPDSKWALD